jgi:competence protein ComEA
MRVDLNTASTAELEVLPGIGPRLAERIAADRAAHGPFATVDDLTRVSGIGERLVDGIRPFAVADPGPSS